MSKKRKPASPTEGPDGQLHDADGLVVDEYSDPSIKHEPNSDALDDPTALVNDAVLDDVIDDGGGIEQVDIGEAGADVELLGDGARRSVPDRTTEDEVDEPHSADELARASVGLAIDKDAATNTEE